MIEDTKLNRSICIELGKECGKDVISLIVSVVDRQHDKCYVGCFTKPTAKQIYQLLNKNSFNIKSRIKFLSNLILYPSKKEFIQFVRDKDGGLHTVGILIRDILELCENEIKKIGAYLINKQLKDTLKERIKILSILYKGLL